MESTARGSDEAPEYIGCELSMREAMAESLADVDRQIADKEEKVVKCFVGDECIGSDGPMELATKVKCPWSLCSANSCQDKALTWWENTAWRPSDTFSGLKKAIQHEELSKALTS